MAFKPPPALPKLSAPGTNNTPARQRSQAYSRLAPDVASMERNVGQAIAASKRPRDGNSIKDRAKVTRDSVEWFNRQMKKQRPRKGRVTNNV